MAEKERNRRLAEEIIEHCAPTLAGIKTANLFKLQTGGRDITDEIRSLNRRITKKGIRIVPVRKTTEYTLLYLYRPEYLKRDLKRPEAKRILAEKGYEKKEPAYCLAELVKHLADDETFPHEIGLFLGYPPADVRGFMQNPCKGVKCSGCWKVYGNPKEAEQTFARYKHCTAVYCRQAKCGKSLESLVVDTDRKRKGA